MNTDGIRLFLQSPRVHAAAALTGSFALGAALSFVATKKVLASKYEELSTKEILEAKLFYSQMYKKDSFSTPEEAAAVLLGGDSEYTNSVLNAAEALRSYSGEGILVDPKTLVEVTTNVFTDAALPEDGEWDLEREITHRTNEEPYVISEDEYGTNETGYQQISVTYYEEDGVLADDSDRTIEDTEKNVGEHNMSRFGHGSGDPNIVFIRNDKIEVEFEVARSKGSYAREVLGFEPELKHSGATLRRFRDRDE